jgi:hypothetical protein
MCRFNVSFMDGLAPDPYNEFVTEVEDGAEQFAHLSR